jgi:alcohol dehydrogenase class IV
MSLITYLTRIHFADRVLEDALPEEAAKLGLRRPLVVSDPAGEADDIGDRVADALPPGCEPVALRVRPSALRTAAWAEQVRRGIGTYHMAGCDGVIGLGGSVALDLARLIGDPGGARAQAAPVIAIPTTTAGVGIAPLPRPAWQGAGRGTAGGQARVPALVLCDPTLTTAAGPEATAAAGMDALAHCIESYLGTSFNPPADGIALEGVRRAGASLERAVANGQDLEARRELLAAALNAGLAAQKGLGGVHALAHALEAETALAAPHGRLHAALFPPVLAFNAPAVGDRLAVLTAALGGPGDRLDATLSAMAARLGLPLRLGALGLDRAMLARAAARAAEDPATLTNPRLAGARDYLAMLEDAL